MPSIVSFFLASSDRTGDGMPAIVPLRSFAAPIFTLGLTGGTDGALGLADGATSSAGGGESSSKSSSPMVEAFGAGRSGPLGAPAPPTSSKASSRSITGRGVGRSAACGTGFRASSGGELRSNSWIRSSSPERTATGRSSDAELSSPPGGAMERTMSLGASGISLPGMTRGGGASSPVVMTMTFLHSRQRIFMDPDLRKSSRMSYRLPQ